MINLVQQCLKELRAANQIEKMREQESMEEYKNESDVRTSKRLGR